MDSLSLQPVFPPWILVVVGLLLVGVLAVGPAYANLTRGRRCTLLGLRGLTLLLIALTLLRPGCLKTVEKKQMAVLLFLLDKSRSMQLPHQAARSERWKALTSTITENLPAIFRLKELQVDVRFQAFDRELTPLEMTDNVLELPPQPDGAETDIGKALQGATQGLRDQRLLGVVLATDGVQNAVDSEVELLNAVSDIANQGIAIYGVPFGSPAEVSQQADVAITNLPDHDSVFVKNRKNVRASLVTRGFANQNITVQLVISRKDQAEQIVDEKTFVPRGSYEELPIELSYVPQVPGSYRMTVRAVAMPNEAGTLNNELTSFLTVYEGGLRVLLICDVDWWEQSRLRRTLPASGSGGDSQNTQGIEIVYLPISQADRSRWPLSGEITEAIRDPSIDVVILADVDSRALYQPQVNEENLRALEEKVASGKGLLMAGGLHSFGPGYYWRTPLADVLPILMRGEERQEFDQEPRQDLHIPGAIRIKPVVSDDPLVQLSDRGDTLGDWQKLPPLPGANRFSGIKDTARVLLATEQNDPILVAGNYGGGRVLALAIDSTFLWYSHLFQQEYRRFWQQIILWLAFPDGTAKDNVRILLAQRRFSPSSPVTFTTEARTITGQPVPDATFSAVMISPTGREQPIPLSAAGGVTKGVIEPQGQALPGIYAIRVRAQRGNESIGETEVEYSIYDQDKEKAILAADHKLLQRLADETRESGGKLVPPEELGKLLQEIADNPADLKIKIPQRWQLGQTTGDGIAFLSLFVLVISCEWALRKKWGLV